MCSELSKRVGFPEREDHVIVSTMTLAVNADSESEFKLVSPAETRIAEQVLVYCGSLC